MGHWLALAALLVVASALRLADARIMVFSPDQMWSVELARAGWGELVQRTAADVHPPFYYALLKVWYAITPATLFSAQALSVLFAAGTLAVVVLFTRWWAGEWPAWIAGAFWAVSPYMVYWNHSARNHQLLPLFVIVVVAASYLWAAERRRRWLALAALCWAGAIHTNYMAVPFGVVWGLAFLAEPNLRWRDRGVLFATPLPGLVTFLPWLPSLVAHSRGSLMNINFFQESVTPASLAYHSVFGLQSPYVEPEPLGFVYVARLALFASACVAGAFVVGRRWSFWILLAGSSGLPILLAYARGMTLAERHLHFALPLFFAFWGVGLWHLATVVRRRFGLRQ